MITSSETERTATVIFIMLLIKLHKTYDDIRETTNMRKTRKKKTHTQDLA